jgi:hypothetical protein
MARARAGGGSQGATNPGYGGGLVPGTAETGRVFEGRLHATGINRPALPRFQALTCIQLDETGNQKGTARFGWASGAYAAIFPGSAHHHESLAWKITLSGGTWRNQGRLYDSRSSAVTSLSRPQCLREVCTEGSHDSQ